MRSLNTTESVGGPHGNLRNGLDADDGRADDGASAPPRDKEPPTPA